MATFEVEELDEQILYIQIKDGDIHPFVLIPLEYESLVLSVLSSREAWRDQEGPDKGRFDPH